MKKKKLTYMLAVTQDYVFAAGNIVLSLIKQRPEKDFDITIFYDDMLPCDKKIFTDTGICTLIEYKVSKEFEKKIRTNCPKFNDENFAKHFSFLKFAKFEIFSLLDKYENAVWLDADIAIQDDPYDIINYPPFAITEDRGWTVQNNFTAPIPGYDMEKSGVCSAVFLVTDKLPDYQKMKDWCYKKAEKLCPHFKNIDQGIFNILLQEFKIEYQLLPLDDYQCFTDRDEGSFAKIAHFGGKAKVWNNTEMISSFPEWYRMHLKWMKLGGSDFSHEEKFSVINVYKKLQDRNRKIKNLQDEVNNLKNTLKGILDIKKNEETEIGFKIKLLGISFLKKKVKKDVIRYYFLGFIPVLIIKTTKNN